MSSPLNFLICIIILTSISACSIESSSAEYVQSAKKYINSGQLSAAVIEARNAVKADVDNAEARKLLGTLELHTANLLSSEKQFRKAVELGTPYQEVILELSHSLLLQNKYDEVLELSEDLVLAEEKVAFKVNLAAAHFYKGEKQKAEELAAFALKMDSKSVPALVLTARLQASSNDAGKARQNLATALELSPDYSEAWMLLGSIEAEDELYEQAHAAYSKAIENSFNIASPLLHRAQISILLSNFDDAERDFEVLQNGGFKHPLVNVGKSTILSKQGDYQNAQLELEHALKLEPDFLPAVQGIALMHLRLGNLGQAEQYAKKLLSATDTNFARTLLSAVRLESGRYELAEIAIKPLAHTGTLDPYSARILNTIFLKQKKYEESVDLMFQIHNAFEATGEDYTPILALLQPPAISMLSEETGEILDSESYLSAIDKQLIMISSLISKSSIDKALSAINDLEIEIPNSSIPHSLRGRALFHSGDLQGAKSSLEKALPLSSSSDILAIFYSRIEHSQHPEKAMEFLESAVRNATGDSRENIMLELARQSQVNNLFESSLQWLTRSKDENPNSFRTNLELAKYHAAQGNYLDVLASISSIDDNLLTIPKVAELHISSLLHTSQFDEAIYNVNNLILLFPDSANWYFLRSMAYAGISDAEQMRDDLNYALKLDPEHYNSLLVAANLRIGLNDLESAEYVINILEKLNPDTEALSNVKNNFVKAKLPPSDKKNNVVYTTTTEVLEITEEMKAKGKSGDAINLMMRWLKQQPNDSIIWLSLGNTLGAENRIAEAVDAYRKALKNEPDNFIVLNNLAWYLRETEPTNALKYARQAVNMQPENISALDTLIVVLRSQGELDEAKQIFERTQELGADDPNIIFHGALVESDLDNPDKALELLTPVIESGVDFFEKKKADLLFEKLK